MTENSPKEILLERLTEEKNPPDPQALDVSNPTAMGGYMDGLATAREVVKDWFKEFGLTFQLKLDNTPAKRSLSEVEARAEQLRDALNALGIQTLPIQGGEVSSPTDRYKGTSDMRGGENIASEKEQPLWCKKCGEPVGVFVQGDALVLGCKRHRTQIASMQELPDRLKVDWVGQDEFEEELE